MKQKILAAAINCFTKNGFHKTGMRDIAKIANVSIGNLYNYFTSKQEIIEDIILLHEKELEININVFARCSDFEHDWKHNVNFFNNCGYPPDEKVWEILQNMCNKITKDMLLLFNDIISEVARNDNLMARLRDFKIKEIEALGKIIKYGQEIGTFDDTFDANFLSQHVLSLMQTNDYTSLIFNIDYTTNNNDLYKLCKKILLK